MSKVIRVAVAGCGSRGYDCYSQNAHKLTDRMQIVAAADPDPVKLQRMKDEFSLPDEMCFRSVEEMFAREKFCDAAFICTPDALHHAHAMAALKQGYHLMLEKPIAQTAEECLDIERESLARGLTVVVCHVLRYTPFYQEVRRLIREGAVGDVVSVQAQEQVCYWHDAHSYVRGNWRSAATSTPMILAKSCHDIDILLWLTGKHCERLSSFGSLRHFRSECAPAGAPQRCTDGCPHAGTCPYNAERFYLDMVRQGKTCWPVNILNPYPTEENILEALKSGPYGRCVYHCDNDVVDHQIVNMELEDGVTVDFNMCAFTGEGGRLLHVMGTHGDILGDMDHYSILVRRYGQPNQEIDIRTLTNDFSGHGGGDFRLLCDFLDQVEGGHAPNDTLTSISASVESHLVCFSAEQSRLEHGKVVELG